VQITISALRRMLGDAVIVTQPPGYVIQVPAESIDLARFEKLTASGAGAAAEGRLPEAVHDLRAALALWSGSALEGVPSDAVQGVAARLNERRVSAYQDCLELELQLGRHREIVGDLTELVAAHPLNERLRGQLMLALYRSGRQADALEAFRAGRQVFQEELGLDPPPELRQLEQAMLTRDPQVDRWGPRQPAALRSAPGLADKSAATPVPRQLPRTIMDFTGRDEILDEISQLVTGQARGGRPLEVPVILLVGRGGVGKTALAVHAGHLLSSQFPDGQLFVQIRQDMAESTALHMENLLRALGVHPSIIPPDMDGRGTLYRSVLAERRVLVVIDGAHRKSDIVPYLPGTSGCAAIVTSNNDITELEGVQRLRIGPLDDQSASSLLETLIGARRMDAEPDGARELIRLCEGIPLALRVVAAKLSVRPHWSISHIAGLLRDEARRLDELDFAGASVRATIAMAYETLDAPAQRLLRRLSLAGAADFPSWAGAPLLDAEIPFVEYVLQQLVAVHLVEATTTDDKVVRFHLHDLVRIYAMERCAEDETTASRQDAVRRLLSCLLFLATTARRRIYGGDFAVLHGTADHWPVPEQSVAELQNPIEWFRIERRSLVAGICQAAAIGMDELCWDLAVTAVTVFESGLYGDADWRESHACALGAVRDSGNRRGEAALLYSLGTLETSVRVASAIACFEQSMAIFDDIGDKQGRALALSGLALVHTLKGDYDGALERYGQAIAGFREIGDLASEAYALKSMAQISASRLDYTAAESMLDDALSIARDLDVPRLTAQTELALAELHLRRGRAAAAADLLSSALHLTSAARDVVGQAFVLAGMGDAKRALGDFEGAESALRAALDLATTAGNRLAWGRSLLGLAEIRLAKGEEHAALAQADEASTVLRELGARGLWQARTLELVGRIYERVGRLSIAMDMWNAAAELARGTDPDLEGQITRSLARVRAAAPQ
jgi:DNA-binding SARP family transcriptional activator